MIQQHRGSARGLADTHPPQMREIRVRGVPIRREGLCFRHNSIPSRETIFIVSRVPAAHPFERIIVEDPRLRSTTLCAIRVSHGYPCIRFLFLHLSLSLQLSLCQFLAFPILPQFHHAVKYLQIYYITQWTSKLH